MIAAAKPFEVTREQARIALQEYRQHRNTYDKRDWEIERIYRQIAKGKTVISVHDAIRRGGLDSLGRPRLAVMRADQAVCQCVLYNNDHIVITNEHRSTAAEWHFEIAWPGRARVPGQYHYDARLPRIPPQHRPAGDTLVKYHLLWEAEWGPALPRDPYLLRRIGKDAWVVLAAWDLTEVELSVLRAAVAV